MDEDAWKAEYKIDPEFKDYISYIERNRTKGDLSDKTLQKFQQIEGFYQWEKNQKILRYKGIIDGEIRHLIGSGGLAMASFQRIMVFNKNPFSELERND